MNKSAWITILVIVLIVVVGWAVYAAMDKNSMSNTSTNTTQTTDQSQSAYQTPIVGVNSTTTVTSTTTVSTKVDSFTVTGKNFSFSPSKLTVKKGDTVKITFISSGASHDLKIDAFNVTTNILSPGQQQTVTFVANQTGSFEYYCSIANHRAMGMVGTLTVTE